MLKINWYFNEKYYLNGLFSGHNNIIININNVYYINIVGIVQYDIILVISYSIYWYNVFD